MSDQDPKEKAAQLSPAALAAGQAALKKRATRVRKPNGDTFEVDIRDPALPPKNYKKGARPKYLEAKNHIVYEPTPSFDFGDEKGRADGLKYLEKNGYVVAKAVLDQKEVKKARSLFWEWVEELPNRLEVDAEKAKAWPKRGDASTWDKNFPGNPDNGIIANMGAGQSPFSWFVRSRARVKQVFEAVWATDDLLVSFDGFGSFRPWSYDPSWRTRGGWFHVDQNPIKKPGLHCVQGLVSMYDQDKATGGLTVIPGSQSHFPELAKKYQSLCRMGLDFIPIPRADSVLKKKIKLVSCKAGDLCLWDSRVIHCNTPAPKKRANKKSSSSSDEKNDDQAPSRPTNEERKKEEDVDNNTNTNNNTSTNAEKEKAAAGEGEGEGKGGGASSASASASASTSASVPAEASSSSSSGENELLRLVCYVCMTPTSKATRTVIEGRKEAVKNNSTTNHWPHELSGGGRLRKSPDYDGSSERYIVEELVHGRNAPGTCVTA